ncbi:hypothetical protein FXV83_39810 [Bradyrhizobium hipponense]|uniref:Uncharacterized protein n=1 Tax=Bradyrhizobium hipponense TaxID=2605638 RepID=A0A5S4Y9M6_9BRAD|nr:enoyl-CoA hydratase-related protein [Bradyrhizobium hipponense]TYO61130.1 hypothetical protein FXV83_39810 [Bradyrhizobium hipponense]
MLTDVVITGEGALFGQPEIKRNSARDGTTQRLTRVSLAMLMILDVQSISVHTAIEPGMVAEVAEAGKARALGIADVLAHNPPHSIELAKASVLAARQTTPDAGVEFERQAIRVAFTGSDQQEGMNASFEER